MLGRVGVATAHEAMGRRGLTDPVLQPIDPGARIAGRAVTVLSHPGGMRETLGRFEVTYLDDPGDDAPAPAPQRDRAGRA